LKKKLAFIVQRYGLEVNGGAEYHCRIVVEKLKDIYDIEVLTSCATDYLTWADEYPEGETAINNVKVRRFASGLTRDWPKFKSIGRKLRKRKPYQKILRFLGLLSFYERIIPASIANDDYEKWIQYQGPYLPKLIEYLNQNQQNYCALIFFTYLYYPTIYGIKVAPEKSILIPTAHDEPPIYFPFFKKFFNTPKAILYNTISEKRFVNRMFNNDNIYSDIVGVGIEPVEPAVVYDVKEVLKTDCEYLIYIGRIDASKGCKILCNYFLDYKKTGNKNIKLVFVGQTFMQIPVDDDIIAMGFIDEDIKIALLKNAMALIIPSFYESLSLVTLESMAYGIPVIANKDCEVLKDHIENSHAGFLFNDYKSFEKALDTIVSPQFDVSILSANAKKYVAENYTWDVTIKKYQKAIAQVSPR
jgi:glycosyltransferase involved in cell wall biosynthesis